MKVKVSKKPKKGKVKNLKLIKKDSMAKPTIEKENKFKDKYLEFYDDIKVSTKRYDW